MRYTQALDAELPDRRTDKGRYCPLAQHDDVTMKDNASYRLLAGQPPAAEVRRVLGAQNAKALELLQTWHADPAKRIHRARQTFKRIRALLRAIRPVSRYVFMVENRFYRDLARTLSYARDAEAMAESVRLLEERLREPLPRQSWSMLRTSLERRAVVELANSISGLSDSIEVACAELTFAQRRLQRLPLGTLRKKDLKRGVAATVRRGAHAYWRAVEQPEAENFHALRKFAKYAYNQARVMKALRPGWSSAHAPALAELEQALGQMHDLVVLDSFLRTQPDSLGIDIHVRRLRRAIGGAEADIRLRSLQLGRRIFGEPAPGDNVVPFKLRPAGRAR